MTILSGESIRARCVFTHEPIFTPFSDRQKAFGMTFGLGPAGYDVRIAETFRVPRHGFHLGSTMERFHMPTDLIGIVHDKSTWARLGLALQNTVIEPGWHGYLTLELTNHGEDSLLIEAGMPIAQIILHMLDKPASVAYDGKYQNQPAGPQPAILER